MRSPNRSNYQRKVSFPLYISMWQRASDPFGKLSGSIRKGHTVAPRRWERREREAEGGSTRTRRHSVVRPTKSSVSRSEGKKNRKSDRLHQVFTTCRADRALRAVFRVSQDVGGNRLATCR